MSLIVSVSGIRGTIGGLPGDNLTPIDIVTFASAYGQYILDGNTGLKSKIVIGRDGRISGNLVQSLVQQTLIAMGIDVLDAGLSTTPSIEMAVILSKSQGGIILTASHNPEEWNALKLLNAKGEFLSAEEGKQIVALKERHSAIFASVHQLGKVIDYPHSIADHVREILTLEDIPVDLIRSKQFKIVADCINSTGAIALPVLFEALGCSYTLLHAEITGKFAHNPEPLPEHLSELIHTVISQGADCGIAVDPDVDRLALVAEDGSYFGEEYTLVAVADYLLAKHSGNTVSNLSSSRALRDLTKQYGGQYAASAVGEVHVVNKMKETKAIIGGEGNGGVIYPRLHYGRDSLVGIALILAHLAQSGKTLSRLRTTYPTYYMYKDKMTGIFPENIQTLLDACKQIHPHAEFNTIDGVKIDLPDAWIHLRKSNTEPIIRIYTEASSTEQAKSLAKEMIDRVLMPLQ